MRISFPSIALAGVIILSAAAAAGVIPAGVSSAARVTAMSSASYDYSAVPTTTKVNGKVVKLKKMADGLEYYDIKLGTGTKVVSGKSASVQYTGTLTNGAKFDSSYDHGGTPFTFAVGAGQVIPGWDEGVPGIKVGGKRRLVIPGKLAYGPNSPTPAIPANATLVFDIELVDVK